MYQHTKFKVKEVLDVKNEMFCSTCHMAKRLRDDDEPEKDYLTWKEFRGYHKF